MMECLEAMTALPFASCCGEKLRRSLSACWQAIVNLFHCQKQILCSDFWSHSPENSNSHTFHGKFFFMASPWWGHLWCKSVKLCLASLPFIFLMLKTRNQSNCGVLLDSEQCSLLSSTSILSSRLKGFNSNPLMDAWGSYGINVRQW